MLRDNCAEALSSVGDDHLVTLGAAYGYDREDGEENGSLHLAEEIIVLSHGGLF